MNPAFRLILDIPRPAALNMAIDEVLMESQDEPNADPILRIYSWERPAYSIGYFQSVGAVASRFGCGQKKLEVVRRPTGGGLVFHGQDMTFSLSLKNPNPFLPAEAKASYLKVNEVLLKAFKTFYPSMDFMDCKFVPSGRSTLDTVCFETPTCYDLVWNGKKRVGSSQRRKAESFLHQSSVFLDKPSSELVPALLKAFQESWAIEFRTTRLTEAELSRAEKKVREIYTSPDWAFSPFLSTTLDNEKQQTYSEFVRGNYFLGEGD